VPVILASGLCETSCNAISGRSKHEEAQERGSLVEPPRRSFFKRSGALAGGVVTGTTLSALIAHMAWAHDERRRNDRDRRGRGARPALIG
jgi:hypothetical protein